MIRIVLALVFPSPLSGENYATTTLQDIDYTGELAICIWAKPALSGNRYILQLLDKEGELVHIGVSESGIPGETITCKLET